FPVADYKLGEGHPAVGLLCCGFTQPRGSRVPMLKNSRFRNALIIIRSFSPPASHQGLPAVSTEEGVNSIEQPLSLSRAWRSYPRRAERPHRGQGQTARGLLSYIAFKIPVFVIYYPARLQRQEGMLPNGQAFILHIRPE